MSDPTPLAPHPDASPAELSRQAFDFAARHPTHPLAGILRSKAGSAALRAPGSASDLELRLLLDKAHGKP